MQYVEARIAHMGYIAYVQPRGFSEAFGRRAAFGSKAVIPPCLDFRPLYVACEIP